MFLFVFVLLLFSLSASAGDVTPSLGAALRRQAATVGPRHIAGKDKGAGLPVVVVVSEGHQASELGLDGAFAVGRYALASLTAEAINTLRANALVKTIDLQHTYLPKLDRARAATGIDRIHQGEGLPQAYTGRGVVAGIVDTGMDPNHINFRRSDGTSRIDYFASIALGQTGLQVREYDHESVLGFKTENAGQFHGTHTMGILAGGYRGDIDMAETEDGLTDLTTAPCPYYGVATESTIAAATGTLQDAVIATGVDNIINYAYNHDKPCVLSLSLGSNDGPHDGTEVMNQFLDLASKEAIVCISAGNEGDLPIALHKEFAAGDSVCQTFLSPMVYLSDDPTYPNLRYGTVKIYSRDSSALRVQAVVYNKKRGRVAYRMPVDGNTQGVATYYCSADSFRQEQTDIVSPLLDKAVCGYVGVGSMTDEGSGRYMAMIDLFAYDNRLTNADGNYLLGITVEGQPGQRVDLYSDAQFMAFDRFGQDGWADGTPDGSISSMACGHDVIVVGAYNTRNEWASMDQVAYRLQDVFPEGDITSFSSYGTLVDGRQLPTVCAPGTALISSCNYYYYQNAGKPSGMIQALHAEEERESPYCQTMGTSMSTPLVAGAIALWLEADPTLTAAEARDIICQTARRDSLVLAGNPVQWGAGKFDAYEGLKEVLRRKGAAEAIGAVAAKPLMLRRLAGDTYEAFVAAAQAFTLEVYDAAGHRVLAKRATGDTLTFSTHTPPRGLYIVRAGAQTAKIVR